MLLCSAACASSFWAAGNARAGSFTVRNTTTCSLTAAVNAINNHTSVGTCGYFVGGADEIVVPRGAAIVSTSQVELHRAVTIRPDTAGTGTSTLRGNMPSDTYFIRIVDPTASNSFAVTIQGVTIDRTSGGTTTNGVYAENATLNVAGSRIAGFGFGGLRAFNAKVTINDSVIENNTSVGAGGGIQFETDAAAPNCTDLTLRIRRSTIANNGAALSGGGLYFAGACGQSEVWNTTISGNNAIDGGGVAQFGGQYFFINGSTIAFNTGFNSGGGVVTEPFGLGVKISGTIIGQNSSPTGPDISGQLSAFQDSLVGQSAGINNDPNAVAAGVTFMDTSPNLDPTLRDLGGPNHTKVHRVLFPSFAIDVIPGTPFWSEGTDQRQVLRPQAGGTSFLNSDMGAFESSRMETEVLAVAARSNVSHVTVFDQNASAGQATNLQANQTGQFVTYSSGAVLTAGTYGVKIGFKKGSTAGQFQFQAGPSSTGPWTTFATQNARASSTSWVTVDFGTITANTTSKKFFRFSVPAGASSPFQIFPDFVEFTRR